MHITKRCNNVKDSPSNRANKFLKNERKIDRKKKTH
jgi:hypothetical protein